CSNISIISLFLAVAVKHPIYTEKSNINFEKYEPTTVVVGKMVEKENVILVIPLGYVCLESKERNQFTFLPLD
ncbi:MAG: hypothetical protein WBF33_27715, partial [Candidatus Nitrosopolaris sp.]